MLPLKDRFQGLAQLWIAGARCFSRLTQSRQIGRGDQQVLPGVLVEIGAKYVFGLRPRIRVVTASRLGGVPDNFEPKKSFDWLPHRASWTAAPNRDFACQPCTLDNIHEPAVAVLPQL